jgi:beta-lactamase superfamily II metal-dependent hydrolase
VPIEFKFLEAGMGDSILLFIDDKVIIIDGGDNLKKISSPLHKLRKDGKNVDLMILTHQDFDHIRGLCGILRHKIYKEMVLGVWFNSFENEFTLSSGLSSNTSTKDAVKFSAFVYKLKQERPDFYYKDRICSDTHSINSDLPNTKINILSPTIEKLEILNENCLDEYLAEKDKFIESQCTSRKITNSTASIEELYINKPEKDNSPSNGSSIAFLLTYKNKYKFLLLADAHIDVIVNSLSNLSYSKFNKLKVDFIKLSHHGSFKNINQDFLDIVDTNKYVILTNGSRYNHPDPETLSFIILNPDRNLSDKIIFLFNYKAVIKNLIERSAFSEENMEKYNFSFKYTGDNRFLFE